MTWIIGFAILAAVVGMLLRVQSKQISSEEAREYLKRGALVIDVRTQAEFNSGHLRNAKNIPLQQIESGSPLPLEDKNQVLLLHCQSGMRSARAKKLLIGMGYVSVFDLGSYSKAAQFEDAT